MAHALVLVPTAVALLFLFWLQLTLVFRATVGLRPTWLMFPVYMTAMILSLFGGGFACLSLFFKVVEKVNG